LLANEIAFTPVPASAAALNQAAAIASDPGTSMILVWVEKGWLGD
jgi:hypothetical protein